MVDFRNVFKIVLRRCLPAKWYRKLAFRLKHGRWCNLKDPRSLNEKLMWRKTYGYKPIHTTISDKYCVREYVSEKVGKHYLVPLYEVVYDIEDFDFKRLPDSFVSKPANSSGQIVMVRDKNEVDEEELRSTFRKWLKSNYFLCREPEYKHIEPKIVIEKLLLDQNGNIPMDYKFHCFAGKVEMVQVDVGRFAEHKRSFYSSAWERLPFNWSAVDKDNTPCFPGGPDVNRPRQLKEMVAVAEALSKDFDYIRVDLYECNDQIYFGELTLTHGGGFAHFIPKKYDFIYGAKFAIED